MSTSDGSGKDGAQTGVVRSGVAAPPLRRRGRDVAHPKGRQVDPAAQAEIRDLLGDRPRKRDLLIEYLHLVQDRYRRLSGAHLAALAEEMRLSPAEIHEVATFYAHFDVVPDPKDPPAVTVRVCGSLSCALAGSNGLIDDLRTRCADGVKIVEAPCMGRCDEAPVVQVERRALGHASADAVATVIAKGGFEADIPAYPDLTAALGAGRYGLLRACRDGRRSVEKVIAELELSGVRGLGGAGFPTARKWRLVRARPGPRLLVINADEGEPGTFKDRFHLETDPHDFLEGMLIAAWAIDAQESYIYLRDEYPAAYRILSREIDALRHAGLDGGRPIHLRRGAGAYICGEESALIESIEGKRGYPRHKPPYPAEVGLFGRPTLTHNVETVHWVREILEHGGDRFAAQGLNGHRGMRRYSVSGRVTRPGVKLAPAGITARALIEDHCGGMADGHRFKAYLPGGASGGILPAAMADIPLDFGTLEAHGCFVGSGAVIVLSDRDDMRAVALNLMRFFADESCGQCTPCRLGTEKAVELMQRPRWDAMLLSELADAMRDSSICGLGQAAPNPLRDVLRFFPEELSPAPATPSANRDAE